jgi:hypothetical protein
MTDAHTSSVYVTSYTCCLAFRQEFGMRVEPLYDIKHLLCDGATLSTMLSTFKSLARSSVQVRLSALDEPWDGEQLNRHQARRDIVTPSHQVMN